MKEKTLTVEDWEDPEMPTRQAPKPEGLQEEEEKEEGSERALALRTGEGRRQEAGRPGMESVRSELGESERGPKGRDVRVRKVP